MDEFDEEFKRLYPLCFAAGEDGNAFRETELREQVCTWCGCYVNPKLQVRQIEIKKKIDKGEELTPEDIADCLLMEDLPGEHWKPILMLGNDYLISDLGRMKALPRFRVMNDSGQMGKLAERILIGKLDKDGYRFVHISYNNVKYHLRIHRLVALAWIPMTEEDKAKCRNQVNHKDGNKLNNCVENLEWCTSLENTRHAVVMGLVGKVSLEDITRIRELYNSNENLSIRDIHNIHYPNITEQVIGDIIAGRSFLALNLSKIKLHTPKSRKIKSADTVIEIRALHELGKSLNGLAKMFNVSKKAILNICNGKSYSEIPLTVSLDRIDSVKKKYNI